jgi:hypothetical protein
MATVYTTRVLGDHLTFGDEDEPRSINMQANGSIGKRRRHAVAIAIEAHQAGWRDELRVLDKAVKRLAYRHEMRAFDGPGAVNGQLL